MSILSNPASSTPAETAAYVAALLELLGDDDPVAVLRETPAAVQRFLDTVPARIPTTQTAPGERLHGERGEESLEHMRQLYAGHDVLHLKQLERIRGSLLPAFA